MFVNNNITAMNSHRHLFNTNKSLDKSLERLSSGLRINSSEDDPSGVATSEHMGVQLAGLSVASQNAQDGQALFKIAEGALAQVTSMLTRMEELAVRASNGTLTAIDRTSITDEVAELQDQINQISKTTEYNTLKLMNGSLDAKITISGNDSITILNNPAAVKGAELSFHLTQLSRPAYYQGNQIADTIAKDGVTTTGFFTVNGASINVNAGDSIEAIVGKINAVNDQTGVIATVEYLPSVYYKIDLVSGIIDDDAKNISKLADAPDPNDFTDEMKTQAENEDRMILGYALQGEQYSINVAGGSILSSIGMSAFSATGTNAAGSINGVAMKATGSVLENAEFGSSSFGLKLDTDTVLGGKGAYVRNQGVSYTQYAGFEAIDPDHFFSTVHHQSEKGDTATIKIEASEKLQLQVGANFDQSFFMGMESIATNQLGIGGSSKFISLADIKLDTAENANYAIKTIQKALSDVTANRSRLGFSISRLDYTISTLAIQRENMSDAQSRIQDADISQEMTAFTKQQIILQSGTAMLGQANARPQSVLSLLN